MPTVHEYATQFHYNTSTTAQHIMNNPQPVQQQQQQQPMVDLAEQLMAIEEKLAEDLMKLTYEFPVEYVYNPIKHAKELHYNFLKRYYRSGPKPILFLGMNPGPWGMVQTGKLLQDKSIDAHVIIFINMIDLNLPWILTILFDFKVCRLVKWAW